MHVRGARCTGRPAGVHGRRAGARGAQPACAGARLDALEASGRGCARVCAAGRAIVRLRVHCSPESTIFARNEEINLK
ncbi:hypothetical protein CDL15_Pgr005034 [Punica granatum]|uniref:Uncharacterized protein n=1 Tax=Punica granatum TaxID=22663 RepID=A0A218WIC4_PUNGR|nr:hypothetical protein CDL15_Pgr005034 [Punica granatum]